MKPPSAIITSHYTGPLVNECSRQPAVLMLDRIVHQFASKKAKSVTKKREK